MSIASHLKESRIGQFWLKYEKKIILSIGIILIVAISFEAGFLQGQKNKQEPVVINKIASANVPNSCECKTDTNSASADTKISGDTGAPTTEKQNCAYVASKNSNKYHLATCQWAQRIKPENKICFSSAEEAQKRGYIGAKCCIK